MKEIILNSFTLDELEQTLSKVLREFHNNESNQQYDKAQSIKYVTREEVAKLLHISKPTLNSLTKSGKLISYRIGSRILYNLSEVEKSLEQISVMKYKRNFISC